MKSLKEAEAKHISSIFACSILLPLLLILLKVLWPLNHFAGKGEARQITNTCACIHTHTHTHKTYIITRPVSLHFSSTPLFFPLLQEFFCIPHYMTSFSIMYIPCWKAASVDFLNPLSPSHHKLSFKPFLEALNPSAIVSWTLGRNLKPWQQLTSWRLCPGPLWRHPHCWGQTVQCT